MATIRPRKKKDGSVTWEVQIRRKGHLPLNESFPKKFLAEQWAREHESKIDNGSHIDTSAASKTLLTDLLDKYLLHITPTKEASSHVPEKARIGTLKRHFPGITLAKLNVDLVLGYVDERLSEKKDGDKVVKKAVSSDAVRRELQLLSDCVDSATTLWGLHIVANPVPNAKRILRKLRKLKPGNRRERRLLPGEYERIAAAPHTRVTFINRIALFAIETGLRRGELANAQREYVDTVRRVLYVPKSKTDWKTGRKGRVVPLSSFAIELLEGLPAFINGSLFGMTAHSISQAFERLCENQGIVDLRFHDLRHECISRWFEKGFRMEEVAAMSGHSDWRSLKRYTHPDPEKLALRL